MCGIVGIIARKTQGFYHSDLELMESLLLLDTVRGPDSTGAFSVMRDKSLCLTKIGSHPLHLFTTPAWAKHRSKSVQHGRIMIGHNRKATSGSINSENSHPFYEENIVLVHNGMVRGGHKKMAEVDVDSHAVCHAFNEKGAEEVLKTLDAAFAFVWWDVKQQKLFAVRNSERPLTISVTEDLYIMASEAWMAAGIAGRMNPVKKITETIVIDPGVLYSFDLNGKMETKTIELRKEPVGNVHYLTHTTGGGWDRDWQPGTSRRIRTGPSWADADDDIDDVLPTTVRQGVRKAIEETMACGTPFSSSEHFHKGDELLCRIYSAKASPSGDKTQVSGTCLEPGLPQIDIVGFVDGSPNDAKISGLFGEDVYATVTGFASSTCGPSLWVGDIKLAPQLDTHMGKLDPKAWNYVLLNERCKDCGRMLQDCDREFTSVAKRSTSEYRVTCADCIETKLPIGEIRDSFNSRRLDAVQDGVAVVQEPRALVVVRAQTEGGETVH